MNRLNFPDDILDTLQEVCLTMLDAANHVDRVSSFHKGVYEITRAREAGQVDAGEIPHFCQFLHAAYREQPGKKWQSFLKPEEREYVGRVLGDLYSE